MSSVVRYQFMCLVVHEEKVAQALLLMISLEGYGLPQRNRFALFKKSCSEVK